MRIVLVMSEASLWKPGFVEDIVAGLPAEHRVVGAVLTRFRPRGVGHKKHIRRYLDMLGPRLFFTMAVREAWHDLLDRVDRRVRLPGPHSIAGVCRRRGIPIIEAMDVNDPAVVQRVRALEPDILVSSGNQIFKRDLLKSAKVACINRHTSLLPAYKGIYPLFWCLLNEEKEVGVSLHVMTPKIDEGGVIGQIAVPIDPKDTFFSLFERCFAASGPLVVETVGKLAAGTAAPIVNGRSASYYSYPSAEDVHRFRQAGKRMI